MADLARRQERGGYLSWSRFDDNFAQHPKIVGLSDESFRLHVTAICYASRQQTDGFLHKNVIEFIAHRSKTRTKRMLNQLVFAGLWEERTDGYAIHDYLDYHDQADELASKRETKRQEKVESGRIGGVASGVVRRSKNEAKTKQTDEAKTKRNEAPNPDPNPDPIKTPPAASTSREAAGAAADFSLAARAFEELCGVITKPVADKITEAMQDGIAVEWIVAASEEAALHNGRSWSYVSKILENWKLNGFKAGKKGMIRGRAGTDKILDPYADFKPLVPRGKPSSDAWGNPLADEQTSQTMDAVLPQKSTDELQGIQGTGDVSRAGGDG